MSPDLVLFWLAAASLAVVCLAAIAVRALAEFSPHELQEICQRKKSDRLGEVLRERDRVGLAAEALQAVTTAVFVGAATAWTLLHPEAEATPPGWLLASSLVTGIVALLAFEIWIPRAVVQLWAEPFLFHTWPVWRMLSFALSPLAFGARLVDALLHRLAGRTREEPDEESFEEDIRTIVTEGHREGLLEEDAREMIEGIIELGDLDVSEVMTPRTDMVTIPTSLSWQEALEFIIQVGHTRIPVTDKSQDDVVGILYAKDLLPELAKPPEQPKLAWPELLRQPYFVPETKPIDALLQEFQRTRNHMAIVLDEYGGVAGLVTMEDVLEEIVGEIVDEYDPVLVDGIRQLDEHRSEALGKVHIDEINERLGLDLPEEADFDTIGGFVFSQLGRIPTVGEEVVFNGTRIRVVEATARRIERVHIEREE